MTSPEDRKTMQVSTVVHARVYELAAELETSASGVLSRFLDKSSVHITPSERQRERWEAAAADAGMDVERFVEHLVESCLMWGTDLKSLGDMIRDIHGKAVSPVMDETIRQTYYRVDALAQVAGLTPPPRPPVVPRGD